MSKWQAFPKKVIIRGEEWDVKYCRLPKDLMGDCNPGEKLIRVSRRLTQYDALATLAHEIWHSYEHEDEVDVCHVAISTCDEWFAAFCYENIDVIKTLLKKLA
jgi:hypothetical protein